MTVDIAGAFASIYLMLGTGLAVVVAMLATAGKWTVSRVTLWLTALFWPLVLCAFVGLWLALLHSAILEARRERRG